MFFRALWTQLLRAQPANYLAEGRNYRRSGERPKSRSPQGCMNVFLDPLGQGAAGAARNPPGFKAKRLSPPRVRQIPQLERLHDCFWIPLGQGAAGAARKSLGFEAKTTVAPQGHAKSRSPQGCRNVFLDPFGPRYRGLNPQLARP